MALAAGTARIIPHHRPAVQRAAVRIAVAKYSVGAPADFACFAARITALLQQAARRGARIAVLPEYLSLELAYGLGPEVYRDLAASLAATQVYRAPWMALFSSLARRLDMHIVAGSFLLEHRPGRYRNRCDCFTADGRVLWQDKLQLTSFEYLTEVIDPGQLLHAFQLDGVAVGVAICCDSEQADSVRAQALAGVRLLLVPSSTDTVVGAEWVRAHCIARAQENALVVAQAVTAGQAGWSPALGRNTGEAGVLHAALAGSGQVRVLAQTRGDQDWAMARADLAAPRPQLLPRPGDAWLPRVTRLPG